MLAPAVRQLALVLALGTFATFSPAADEKTETYYEVWISGQRYSVAPDQATAQKVVRALKVAGHAGTVKGPFQKSTTTAKSGGSSTGGTTTQGGGTTTPPAKSTPSPKPKIDGPFPDGGIVYRKLDGTLGAYSRGEGKLNRGTQPKFWNVPAVQPSNPNAARRDARIVYVNGINTDSQAHADTLQVVADLTGAAVIGVYNKTDGMGSDLAQCVQDKARDQQDAGNNPATTTMKEMILDAVANKRQINIVAHSQGALITLNAVRHARHDLYTEEMYAKLFPLHYKRVKAKLAELNKAGKDSDWDDLMEVAQYNDEDETLEPIAAEMRTLVEGALNRYVSITTYGGAGASWPDGPKYRHVVNTADLVPMKFGLGDPDKWKDMPTSEREARDGSFFTRPFRNGWFPRNYGGRGAEMVAITKGEMFNRTEFSIFGKDFSIPTTPDFGPHDINGVYLKPGVVPGYTGPIDYDYVRGTANGIPTR